MVDLRARQSPIRDQGRRGTCVACAATGAHEMLRGGDVSLCIEFAHWGAKQRDGLPEASEGTTLAAAAAVLDTLGQPPESRWPYDERRDQWAADYAPPDGASDEALHRRTARGAALVPSVDAVRAALDGGRAPLLGVILHGTWYTPGAGGEIAMPTRGAVAYGGHAVLVVGYATGAGAGGGHFIVRNSWGTGWGDGGDGYLPFDYVTDYGIAAWALGDPIAVAPPSGEGA